MRAIRLHCGDEHLSVIHIIIIIIIIIKLYYRLAVHIRRHIWQLSKSKKNTTLQYRDKLLQNTTRHEHIAAPSSGNVFTSLCCVTCLHHILLIC